MINDYKYPSGVKYIQYSIISEKFEIQLLFQKDFLMQH